MVALLNHYLSQWHEGKTPVYVKGDLLEVECDAVTQWDKKDVEKIQEKMFTNIDNI